MNNLKLKGLIAILCLTIGLAVWSRIEDHKAFALERGFDLEKSAAWTEAFGNLNLQGSIALIYGKEKKEIIFNKFANKKHPLASVTKVMTALVALENNDPEEVITISRQALLQEGDTGLRLGERWGIENAVKFMLLASSNDTAYAVAENYDLKNGPSAFVTKMNEKAKALGLENTAFYNPSGLDLDKIQPGASGTALDVAKMLGYAAETQGDIFSASKESGITLISLDGIEHEASNTNKISSEIPYLIASKTGYSDLAGGNLAVAFGNPVVVTVVMGSTIDGRFEDMKKLIDAYFKYESMLKTINNKYQAAKYKNG
jgi:D-alanyl-D-alanine carboxypeptidase